ncbi:MAG: hypothetical protein QNJ81_13935 [Acidimicrobiia bacterium]|nr:hypothetical protein [Acidimicrobiia bacterium]
MAIIQAQAAPVPIVEPWGIINHHYFLQGNEGPDGFDVSGFLLPGQTANYVNVPSPNNTVLSIQAGKAVVDFTDIFYNRVAVIPSFLDVGNVSSAQSFQVEVWNGFFENRTLTAINEIDAEGIVISGGVPVGGTFPQLKSFLYDITVEADGPPIINAFIQWVLSADSGELNIIGNRLNVFGFEPDSQLTETLGWKTDIIQSFSGEQRIRVRDAARQSFEFTTQADNGIQTRINNLLYGWQDKVFALPYWVDAVKHPTAINALDMTIFFDTTFLDFRAGGLALIWENDYTNEAVEIDTVEADRLNLLREVVNDYPNGALVIPIVRATVQGGLRRQIGRGDDTRSVITFRGFDNVENDDQAPVTWTEFEGIEVIDAANIQFGSIDSNIILPERVVDNISGVFDYFPERDFTAETANQGYIVRTKEDRFNLRNFFYRRRGRLKPFWYDTNRPDYEVIETIAASSINIVVFVANQKFLDIAENNFALHLVLKDGTDFYRNLVGLSSEDLGNNTETLEIDVAFGQEILPEEVDRLSLLILSRFSIDDIPFEHFVGEGVITRVSVPLVSIKNPQVS